MNDLSNESFTDEISRILDYGIKKKFDSIDRDIRKEIIIFIRNRLSLKHDVIVRELNQRYGLGWDERDLHQFLIDLGIEGEHGKY